MKDDIKIATVIGLLTAIVFNLGIIVLRLSWAWLVSATIPGVPTLSHVQALWVITSITIVYLAIVSSSNQQYKSYKVTTAMTCIVVAWLTQLLAN